MWVGYTNNQKIVCSDVQKFNKLIAKHHFHTIELQLPQYNINVKVDLTTGRMYYNQIEIKPDITPTYGMLEPVALIQYVITLGKHIPNLKYFVVGWRDKHTDEMRMLRISPKGEWELIKSFK